MFRDNFDIYSLKHGIYGLLVFSKDGIEGLKM